MDEYRRANRDSWDESVPIHVGSDLYDVDGFVGGGNALHPLEIEEMGDVRGQTLLHLQCHIGTDTLSWARLGARVTGIDFSQPAIDAASALSERSGLAGRFVLAELYDAPSVLNEQFDIVYTGIGALNWLPDIRRWAKVVAQSVKPGGVFYMHEFHPILATVDDEREDDELRIVRHYFEQKQPLRWDTTDDYADDAARIENSVTYEWNHAIGETVTALIEAGLTLEFLHEQTDTPISMLRSCRRRGDGWWRLADAPERLPMMYSLRARKPAHD